MRAILENRQKNTNDPAPPPHEEILPIIPLRETVLFPGMIMPVLIGREKSIHAVEKVKNDDEKVLFITQIDNFIDDPLQKDLNPVGTVGKILHKHKIFDNASETLEILVEGNDRAELKELFTDKKFLYASIEYLQESDVEENKLTMLVEKLRPQFERLILLHPKIQTKAKEHIAQIKDPGKLIDALAAFTPFPQSKKLEILNEPNVFERGLKLNELINQELEYKELEKKLQTKVKKNIEKNQREYFLQEQMKTIKKELGQGEDEISEYRAQAEKTHLSEEARERFQKELSRLEKLPQVSPESGVIRSYLDCILDLPWERFSTQNADINSAEQILDQNHYGLEKLKERVLEYIAVKTLNPNNRGPILCFIGPPGTGKTSLGYSIAEALSRKFVKISLGGVRDEAEIRGHRRTYIGSLPGRIIQGLRKVKVMNPVMLLDEVDKMNSDFRGDPAAALLEVLDPEQNHSFTDHYLEIEFNLSQIIFIATANTREGIPEPLFDRMEIIPIAGYTEQEKKHIARKFLIPRQQEENGLNAYQFKVSDNALSTIIHQYTREAGVRNLDREIGKICRKIARKVVQNPEHYVVEQPILVKIKDLQKFLSAPRFQNGKWRPKQPTIGIAIGLAWTEFGGDILPTEVVMTDGKDAVITTGRLGETMKESTQTAFTFVKSILSDSSQILKDKTLHIHFLEGAVPKDGPSAGITITTAIYSLLSGLKVRSDIAMTGEISLSGNILPIGGLKEKVLAAVRAQIYEIIIPTDNEKDLIELPKELREKVTFRLVSHFSEAINHIYTT